MYIHIGVRTTEDETSECHGPCTITSECPSMGNSAEREREGHMAGTNSLRLRLLL